MKFSLKTIVFFLLVISKTNVWGESICQNFIDKNITEESVRKINERLKGKEWIMKKPSCEINANKKDVWVYEYWMNPRMKNTENVKLKSRYGILRNKRETRNNLCKDEWSSSAIKFMDIKFKYKYSADEEIVSLKFNNSDCLAIKSGNEFISSSNQNLKKNASDAMKIYNQ